MMERPPELAHFSIEILQSRSSYHSRMTVITTFGQLVAQSWLQHAMQLVAYLIHDILHEKCMFRFLLACFQC